jgi:hypothetical protein
MAFEMSVHAPTATKVRDQLKRIAKKGKLDSPPYKNIDVWDANDLLRGNLQSAGLIPEIAKPEDVTKVARELVTMVGSRVSRGRGRNYCGRSLLWALADFFELVGGKPTVWWSDKIGRYDSPFLRFVRAFAGHLQHHVRDWVLTGLDDRALVLLEMWKSSGIRNDFNDLDDNFLVQS